MGRRSQAKQLTPQELREVLAQNLRKMHVRSGVNRVQFRAQGYEEDAIDLLAGFMMDMGLSPAFRRDCALDVVRFARGNVVSWAHDGETIDPNAPGKISPMGTVGDEVAAIRRQSELFQALDRLVRQRVPVGEWPADVKQIAGDLQAYADGEASGEDGIILDVLPKP